MTAGLKPASPGGALNPKTALCGADGTSAACLRPNLPSGADVEGSSLRAAETREPRQVREEAAVSGQLWVPRRSLA
jgi:hypothetical protein